MHDDEPEVSNDEEWLCAMCDDDEIEPEVSNEEWLAAGGDLIPAEALRPLVYFEVRATGTGADDRASDR